MKDEQTTGNATANNKLLGGAVPPTYQIAHLFDPEKMTELLYRSKELSDEAFEELVDELGSRAARIVLRAKAAQGDIRAIDLFLHIAKEAKKERRNKKHTEKHTAPTDFIPRPNKAEGDSE
jgi:hypothetical protein